jgi:hypothetical protein
VHNVMFQQEHITKGQARGVIVCVPKPPAPAQLTDYRPITLLNSDYTIYARILTNRMRSILSGLVYPSQHCAAPGNTILSTTSALRDIIAHGEMRAMGLCLLTLDFISAFDSLSHGYLRRIIQSYEFGRTFANVLISLYAEVESSLQINGHALSAFPIALWDKAARSS